MIVFVGSWRFSYGSGVSLILEEAARVPAAAKLINYLRLSYDVMSALLRDLFSLVGGFGL